MVGHESSDFELQPHKRTDVDETMLFSLLYYRDMQTFKKRCRENMSHLNDDNGEHTLLQHACEHGLFDAVKVLLENSADPNFITDSTSSTPILIAARNGHVKIIRLFLHGARHR